MCPQKHRDITLHNREGGGRKIISSWIYQQNNTETFSSDSRQIYSFKSLTFQRKILISQKKSIVPRTL